MIVPTSDTVAVRLPDGVGSELDVVVMIDGKIGLSNQHFKFSYGMPAAESAWPQYAVANQPSTGSISLTITGSNFGTLDYSTFRRMRFSSGEAVRWASDSVVVTKVSAGAFATETLEMTVARVWGTRTQFLSYNLATTSSVFLQNSPTTGSASLTLFGNNYANLAYSIRFRISDTSQESSTWYSDTALACKSSASLGRTRLVMMTAGLRVGSSSGLDSYDFQRISVGSAQNLPGSGSSSLTVLGSEVGYFAYSQCSRPSITGGESTFWESDSSVRIKSSRIASGTRRATVSAGRQVGSVTNIFSTNNAFQSLVRRGNVVSTGSMSLTVYGMVFGGSMFSEIVVVRATPCETTRWRSDTCLYCKHGQTFSATRLLSMTVGQLAGSISSAFSVDNSVSVIHKINSVASASVSITLQGASVGAVSYTQRAFISSTVCEISVWSSDSSLYCRSANSMSTTRKLALSVGSITGCYTEGFSADRISSSSFRIANGAATGSSSVTVFAKSLSLLSHTTAASLSHSSSERTTWISDSALCLNIARGSGFSRQLLVTAGIRFFSGSSIWSFAGNSLSVSRKTNIAQSASLSITLFGLYMGQIGINCLACRPQSTPSEHSTWQSDSSVSCQVGQGYRRSWRIQVTASNVLCTTSVMHSFDLNIVSYVRIANVVRTGALSISMFGKNFNLQASTATIEFHKTACEETAWNSDSMLACKSSKGASNSRVLFLSIGLFLGTTSSLCSYELNSISAPKISNTAGTGSLSFSICGQSLGSYAFSAQIRTFLSAIEGTSWVSESCVRAKSPQGASATRILIATAGYALNSVTEEISYDVPSMSIVFPVNNPPQGSTTFTIFGKMFGIISRSIISRLGGTSCESSIWASESSTFCKMSAGIRGTRQVSVTSKRKIGTRTEIFSYNSPGLSSSSPSNGPTTGNNQHRYICGP